MDKRESESALSASQAGGTAQGADSVQGASATPEDLLMAWLELTLSVKTEKVLREFPFREVLVCRCLHQMAQADPGASVSATQLCERLRMQKPQMAILLARMEDKGLVKRERSQSDRRVVRVSLTSESLPLYEEEHEHVLEVVTRITERYGLDRLDEAVRVFDELSVIAREVIA